MTPKELERIKAEELARLAAGREFDAAQAAAEWAPLFGYLQSTQGHELASRILTLIEGIKKATLDRTAEAGTQDRALKAKAENYSRLQQFAIFALVTLLASGLVLADKFNPTVSFFFGTLVGYAFTRKT